MVEPEPIYCVTCRYVLDVVVTPDGVHYTHPVSVADDHEPVPTREVPKPRLKCDFCGREGVVVVYTSARINIGQHSYDSRWMACEPCAAFLDDRDIRRLVNRVLDALPAEVTRGRRNHLRRNYTELYEEVVRTLQNKEKV